MDNAFCQGLPVGTREPLETFATKNFQARKRKGYIPISSRSEIYFQAVSFKINFNFL